MRLQPNISYRCAVLFVKCCLSILGVFLLATFFSSRAMAQAKYSITDLGVSSTFVWTINTRGQVVGATFTPQGPRAFVWEKTTGLVVLSGPCGDPSQSSACALNTNGVI